MPSPRNHRKLKLSEKSMSFHGHSSESSSSTSALLRRPRTVPDLLSAVRISAGTSPEIKDRLKLTKLLLNVTIQRSIGPVQILISLESTVKDLIAASLRQYVKEGRRPVLISSNPDDYDLHYSQFSLESLDREEKLMGLGSRNFFLCPKTSNSDGAVTTSSSSSCAKEADKVTATKISLPWFKFMDFML